eukprot:TRINITY_DN185_c0_g1_i4.p1 TRINITY_DN185_c0_g1~~TRINITY_DN185_c0_g1_i4.p1  ORF type:complete len:434 (+),score=54.78 TRINITY_DN185_c0_g1_i4:1828-3129(+)
MSALVLSFRTSVFHLCKGLKKGSDLIIFSRALSKEPDKGFSAPRVFLPDGELRNRVLRMLHDDPMAGHLGVKRTKSRIAIRFWWPELEKDVDAYVRQCATCNSNKPKATYKTALSPLPLTGPWFNVHLDYMEMPTPSFDGYSHLLVMVDRFTKSIELAPVHKEDSKSTADAFLKEVILRHGCPVSVTTDGGSPFKGEFSQLLTQYNIAHDVGLPYRHRSNGQAERTIRSIREYLRHYASETEWTKYIPHCRFALNSAISSSHGKSPYLVYTGREPRVPVDNLFNWFSHDEQETATQETKQALEHSQQKMKERYDKEVSKIMYAAGDLVFIRNHKPTCKLDSKQFGPYRIADLSDELKPNVGLENPWVGKDSFFKVHLEDVFPYHGSVAKRELTPFQEYERAREKIIKSLPFFKPLHRWNTLVLKERTKADINN